LGSAKLRAIHKSMDTPVIQTPRLILRPLALTDAPAIQRHFNTVSSQASIENSIYEP
jgi:hypothetical protein